MNGHLLRYLLCIILIISAVGAYADPTSISDKQLADLDRISKRLTLNNYNNSRSAIAKELNLIRTNLTRVASDQRPKLLYKLADETKWGTPERSTAYYVCAWYGVNYERSRDYLLNTIFWGYTGYPGHGQMHQAIPFSWAEDTFSFLYDMYEHKPDFKLLHALTTGPSDGAGSEYRGWIRVDAFGKHPRGMLHVAAMSQNGLDLAINCIHKDLHESEVDKKDFDKAYSIFPVYVKRISLDTKDPLQPVAVRLLNEASKASYMKDNPTGAPTRFSWKHWSPNGQYIVFTERTKSGDLLKCTFAKTGKTINLPAPKNQAITITAWSPDSQSLLAYAYTEQKHQDYGTMVYSPSLFTASPGSVSPKVIWSDSEHKNLYPEAKWIQGGKSILMKLNGQGSYDIGHFLYVMRSDGSGLRRLWMGDFVYTMLSPDESRILLWILPKPWFDSPEPRQMAAVNLLTGAYKVYDKPMVALEPYEAEKPGEEMQWSKNCTSVSLLVRYAGESGDKHRRVTLELP